VRQQRGAFLAVTVLLVATLSAHQPPPNPQARLDTAIAEAIRLIEAQQYRSFLEKFVTADDLKRTLAEDGMSMDAFTDQFIQYLAPLTLKKLNVIRGIAPTMSSDRNQATWFDQPKNRPMVTFKKVSGLWYLEVRPGTVH
jgi:hypothetical protein